LLDDEIFRQHMINYLNDIMSWVINQYKSCPIMINTNCIDENLDNIHPCTTRPLDLEEKHLQNYSKWHS
jgi:hypothetical protein